MQVDRSRLVDSLKTAPPRDVLESTKPTRLRPSREGASPDLDLAATFKGLSYETRRLNEVLDALLNQVPPGALVQQMNHGARLDSSPQRLARLLETLWDFRLPRPDGTFSIDAP
jgi:hypothetical protein